MLSDFYVVANINDKIRPLGRYDIYEQPLEDLLNRNNWGEVTGGGTLQHKTGEIVNCDLEILLDDSAANQYTYDQIISLLGNAGAPKGSKLIIEKTGEEIPFGKFEGMAIYLDGINLSDEVYAASDTEALDVLIKKLTGIKNNVLRYWQGNSETAIYFYGASYTDMIKAVEHLLATHPECENARVEQIA